MTPRERFLLIVPGVLFLIAFGAFELGRLASRKEAERKAIRAQLAAEAAVPPELQEEARVACARAYTAYSVKCQAAHSHAGSLCRRRKCTLTGLFAISGFTTKND